MKTQEWFKFYLYQPLYLPFVYTLVGLLFFLFVVKTDMSLFFNQLGLRLRIQDFHSLYYGQRSKNKE